MNVEETIKKWDRYIRVVANRLDYNNEYFDDYYVTGQYAIVQALEKWDKGKGDKDKFITFFIKRNMLEFKYSKTNIIKIPHRYQYGELKEENRSKTISTETPLGEEGTIGDLLGNEDEQFNQGDDDTQDLHKRLLREHFPKLKETYRNVILAYEIEGKTFQEIGDELGTTKENARQLHKKGIEKLRQIMNVI